MNIDSVKNIPTVKIMKAAFHVLNEKIFQVHST